MILRVYGLKDEPDRHLPVKNATFQVSFQRHFFIVTLGFKFET